jgi:hypothetical protein
MTNREVLRRGGGGSCDLTNPEILEHLFEIQFFKGIFTVYRDQNLVGNELITEYSRQREDNTVICKRVTFFAIVLLGSPPLSSPCIGVPPTGSD